MEPHAIVSREEWLKARTALLAKEKQMTRLRDVISAERLALPWVRIEKDYVFDGPNGKLTLADLFQGRSQLYIKHFMMGPGAQHQCVGCSLEVDHVDGFGQIVWGSTQNPWDGVCTTTVARSSPYSSERSRSGHRTSAGPRLFT